jgi:PqqD family protein of HPr-rel-A system
MTRKPHWPQGVLRPAPSALGAEIEDEVIVFEQESDAVFGLGGVGRRIWALIAEGAHTAEEVAQRLCAEFDADEAVIRTDLAKILGELSAHGLIESH